MSRDVEVRFSQYDVLANSVRYKQVHPSIETCKVITDLYLGKDIIERQFGPYAPAPETLRVTVHFDD